MPIRALVMFLVFPFLLGGCIEILTALDVIVPGAMNGTTSPGDGDTEPDNGDSDGIPVVTLRVSEAFPGVNQTVTLTCDAGSSAGLTFDFQPNDGRLDRGRTAGTAEFTTSESDLGTEFTYTCTATNAFGTSNRSNAVTIIPTG